MELEVGMYVRTELGISRINVISKENIGTFVGTDDRKGNIYYGNEFVGYLIVDETKEDKQWIKDHIKDNIIDLIEVGDYVNGDLVLFAGATTWDNDGNILDKQVHINHNGCDWWLREKYIKSIVTKQQFEAMAYRIGE